jgi:hypothetical protein
MLIFGSGMSSASESAQAAAREAAAQARASAPAFEKQTPKLAIVFASVDYEDVSSVPAAIGEIIGADVTIVGGTSGAGVIGPTSVAARGVSVVLLGGDDIDVMTQAAPLGSPELVDVVPAAQRIAAAADEAARGGHPHYACLVFAPGIFVDGEALVAAVRKGAGARAQLAGGLTGDEMTMDRPKVWTFDPTTKKYDLRSDQAVLTGIFTTKHVGIAARHGWRAVGPIRTVTRAEGPMLFEIDHRPALEVWLEDARKAGATPPSDLRDVALYLANHYEIGIDGQGYANGNGKTNGRGGNGSSSSSSNNNKESDSVELVARAPWSIRASDGAVLLSGSIGEGSRIRVVHASRKDLLRASTNAAADAVMRAGNHVAGALVLACSGRLAALGDEFPDEPALIRERVGAAIGGACVFGEIAKTERDVDAFFNTTAVIVAFSA